MTQSHPITRAHRIVSVQPDEEEIPVEVQNGIGVPEHSEPNGASYFGDRDAGPGRAEPDGGTAYLPDPALGRAGERWQQIQAEFVDDPRKAVADAHGLVDELVERIVQEFTRERANLERQWSQGEEVSTEELRVCLQRYRSFFARILPSADATH
jgi:hypothetical protein